jgi:hypothetical protein
MIPAAGFVAQEPEIPPGLWLCLCWLSRKSLLLSALRYGSDVPTNRKRAVNEPYR